MGEHAEEGGEKKMAWRSLLPFPFTCTAAATVCLFRPRLGAAIPGDPGPILQKPDHQEDSLGKLDGVLGSPP